MSRSSLTLRYQPGAGTPDYYLIEALRQRSLREGKAAKPVILDACRAFWLPIACRRCGEYTPTELIQMGMAAIEQLRRQQEYIREVLNLGMSADTGGGEEAFAHLTRLDNGFEDTGIL